jgi:DNA-nicking Smr family endonuclease
VRPDPDDPIWQLFLRQVKPLPNRAAKQPIAAKATTACAPAPPSPIPPPLPAPSAAPPSHHTPQKRPTNQLRDIDRRTWQRLQRGEWPIERRVDLHGCTLDVAWQLLVQAVDAAWQQQQRCLLVITGVGHRSPNRVGLIKQAMPGWLHHPPLAPKVLAYTQSQPQHGGAGALYLLLRRQRETHLSDEYS